MKTITRMFCAVILSLLLTTLPASAGIIGFNSLNVFGDSLSDIGNDLNITGGVAPPATRYFNGRFSNGQVWVEFIANTLGHNLVASTDAGGFNLAAGDSVSFAYGGTGTGMSNMTPGGFSAPGLLGQVSEYKTALEFAGQTADQRALNIVYAGSNDYLLGLNTDPTQVVGNIRTSIMELYELGGRHFLVPNLIDLGKAPLSQIFGIESETTALSLAHNLLLEQLLQDLEASLTGISLYSLDMYSLSETVFDDPAAFGFTSGAIAGPASGCLFSSNPAVTCTPINFASSGIFWDELHTTSLVHEVWAAEALRSLPTSIPVPSSLLLVLFGLIIQTLFRVRR